MHGGTLARAWVTLIRPPGCNCSHDGDQCIEASAVVGLMPVAGLVSMRTVVFV